MIFVAFILQVVFFVLKITGAVHWTWPVVLVPLWIALVFGLAQLVLGGLAGILVALDRRSLRKSRKVRGW